MNQLLNLPGKADMQTRLSVYWQTVPIGKGEHPYE